MTDEPRVLSDVEILSWGPVTDSPNVQFASEVVLYVEVSKAHIRIPWRLRLKYWWMRRRATEEQRRLADKLSVALEQAMLHGERHGTRDD